MAGFSCEAYKYRVKKAQIKFLEHEKAHTFESMTIGERFQFQVDNALYCPLPMPTLHAPAFISTYMYLP